MKRIIRLDRNENPYSPPQHVINAARNGLDDIHRYPNSKLLDQLRKSLSEYCNVDFSSLFIGSGSDSLIMQVIYLFSKSGKIVTVDPTFSYAARMIKVLDTHLVKFKLSEPSFTLPFEVLCNELENTNLIFIDNPNNPTGKLLLTRDEITTLCNRIKGVVLIDEAYYEFSQVSIADLVENNSNLAVVRTMSKAFGLAGLRIGYLIAGDNIIKQFTQQILPFVLSKPSVYAALSALQNRNYLKDNIESINKEKTRVKKELENMGITVYPSETNFLMISSDIPSLSKKLRTLGIIVMDLSNQMPKQFLRVTIGKEQDNNTLLDRLKKIIKSNN